MAIQSNQSQTEITQSIFSFSDKSIRTTVIRKVYMIMVVQLMVSVGIIATFVYEKNLNRYVQQHKEMYWIAFALLLVLLIVFVCFADFRRRWPINIILLVLFTLCKSFMLATIASYYRTEEVVMAVCICAIVSIALTIFSLQTDFTLMGAIVFLFVTVLAVSGISAICMIYQLLSVPYGSLGALLLGYYLVFLAVLNLYLDFVNMFSYICKLYKM